MQNRHPKPGANRHKKPLPGTPALDALNRRLGTVTAPRMLTPFEIELLGQSKAEVVMLFKAMRETD